MGRHRDRYASLSRGRAGSRALAVCPREMRWRLHHQRAARGSHGWKSVDRVFVRRRAASARTWRSGAIAGAAPVLLEKREVGSRVADDRTRYAGLLGITWLSQLR